MASSKSRLLIEAVQAALNGAGKPADVTVHRVRTRPINKGKLPAMVVFRISEEVTRLDGEHGYLNLRRLVVRVECRDKNAVDGDALDDKMDPLTTWAVVAIMADPTFGGLAENTQEDAVQWVAVEEDEVYGAAAVDFTITYVGMANDPEASTN